MFVLAVASQKGGSGKTTLAGHLAVEAEAAGAGPVALIDTDPQASLTAWWRTRAAARPAFAQVDLGQLREALEDMEQAGIRLTIVDTPPAITDSISRVIGCADLVLIPSRPSPHDFRAAGPTAELATQHRKPVLFVVNAATPRARITADAAAALAELGPVAPVILHNRIDFATSMADGRTVQETASQSAAAVEIGQLWQCVQESLATAAKESELSVTAPPASMLLQSAEPSPPTNRHGAHMPEPAANGSAPDHVHLPQPSAVERRSGAERRRLLLPQKPFGGPDRRILPFGRRQADRPQIGTK